MTLMLPSQESVKVLVPFELLPHEWLLGMISIERMSAVREKEVPGETSKFCNTYNSFDWSVFIWTYGLTRF